MKKLLILPFVLALAGCGTSGLIGQLPNLDENASTAKVVPIRISSLIGAPNTYVVVLDGKDLINIRSGEHAEFLVPTGKHTIGVKCFGGWSPTWKEDTVDFHAKTNEVLYFKISPNLKCAGIQPIESEESQKLLINSKEIELIRK